jgi:hypothetical protein
LPEVGFGLFDRGAVGFIVRRTEHGALDFIGTRTGLAQYAAEKSAGGAQSAGSKSRSRGFEFAGEAVAAAVTEELELKSPV